MEKQHNRGQDGAGVASVKLNTEPGYPFMHRIRSSAPQSLTDVFNSIRKEIMDAEVNQPDIVQFPGLMKGHVPMMGELLLGHLRYGTQGKNDVEYCHPFLKKHTIPARNLALAGNFNLVNTEELLSKLTITPTGFQCESDLAAMIEFIHKEICLQDERTPEQLDLISVLKKTVPLFDGGFCISGLLGNGQSFVMRDAHGIRPCYYYANEEVIVAASERPAIRTAFDLPADAVKELDPGCALIIGENGDYSLERILPEKERLSCSFERIYFSRGSDESIYRERIALGYHLSEAVLEAISHDLRNTIFSFVPNTAEIAFYGLIKGAEDYLNKIKRDRILSWEGAYDEEKLLEMINRKVRIEKIAIKDVKLRTFITEDSSRNEMVQHVYDITYGTVRAGEDTLVVIDDSIVRGTTLKESIIRMLGRLQPKKIIIVSSAPQIRYPDCYGIDMSRMGDFVAFRAAVALLKERNLLHILTDTYQQCLELEKTDRLHFENLVRNIYKTFSTEEISSKIAELVTPNNFSIPVEVIFQKIETLHKSCPDNLGDWYFTGNYPTPGGNKVCNRAFMNYMQGKTSRGY